MFFSKIIKYIPSNIVVILPLVKIIENIDVSIPISITASLTKLSFSENDSCPPIIRNIPIVPEENNILLFIVKKNTLLKCYKQIILHIYMDLLI